MRERGSEGARERESERARERASKRNHPARDTAGESWHEQDTVEIRTASEINKQTAINGTTR